MKNMQIVVKGWSIGSSWDTSSFRKTCGSLIERIKDAEFTVEDLEKAVNALMHLPSDRNLKRHSEDCSTI